VTAGVGGALTLGALANQFRPRGEYDHPSTSANTLAALGGLGTAAYGLAGNRADNIMPTLSRLFGGKQEATPAPTTTTIAATPPTMHPQVAKYMNQDGSVKFRDVIAAPDAELQSTVALLSPQERAQMQQQLNAFSPSFAQRLAARAAGIDIEGQRKRLAGILGATK